jgi:photosystem II oxygen-evolving enhancer protein 2
MWKRFALILLMLCSFTLTGCVSATGGLKAYVDSIDGYEFLYPNGWLPVEVSKGVDVVFRDLIQTTENVSVVVSEVPAGKTLADLGQPDNVGQRLGKRVIAPEGSGREAELVSATTRSTGPQTYYSLEYLIRLPEAANTSSTGDTTTASDIERHTLTSVAVSRGKLYTLSVSAPEDRWEKVHDQFQQMVDTFVVY